MKILLVDNNTVHKDALARSLVGHQVEIRQYEPGIKFNDRNKDLVILSGGGGKGREISSKQKNGRLWYQDEIDYVRKTEKPVLGICMGFEVICKAFGADVEEMPATIKGIMSISATEAGKEMFKISGLKQYKAHKWRVSKAPKEFDLLAKSASGAEIIMHKDKAIIATQFHPETATGTFDLADFQEILLKRQKYEK